MWIPAPELYFNDWTVPLVVCMALCLMICMGILAHQRIRRNCYELFYIAHHVFMVVIVVTLWHATGAWYYLIGALALWVFDRAMRFVRGSRPVTVHSLSRVSSDVVALKYVVSDSVPNSSAAVAGQYAYINVPSISTVQWHPFTIASSPFDESTAHYIKSMGAGTWTARLAEAADELQRDAPGARIAINVDGPYGGRVQPLLVI